MGVPGLSPGTAITYILLKVLVNHMLNPITSVIDQWGVTFVSARKLVTLNLEGDL